MAIPYIVAGALKTALKKSIKEVTKATAKEVIAGKSKEQVLKVLKEVSKKQITDSQAILLNRLKSSPSKILWDYVSKDMGIPVSEVRAIVRHFKQSEKMKEVSKGKNFREIAETTLKNKLKKLEPRETRTIKKILDELKYFTEPDETLEGITAGNRYILKYLDLISKELHTLIPNPNEVYNESREKIKLDMDVYKHYNKSQKYDFENVRRIEEVLDNMGRDIDSYQLEEDSGADLIIYQDNNYFWEVIERHIINDYLEKIHTGIIYALREIN